MDNFNSLIYFQFNVCTGKKGDLELLVLTWKNTVSFKRISLINNDFMSHNK